jgi:hypothetical protein
MGVLPRAHSAVAVRCQQKGEKGSAIRVHPVLSVVKTPFPQFPPVKLPPRVQRLPRLSIPFCGAFPNQCCLILVRPPIRQISPFLNNSNIVSWLNASLQFLSLETVDGFSDFQTVALTPLPRQYQTEFLHKALWTNGLRRFILSSDANIASNMTSITCSARALKS